MPLSGRKILAVPQQEPEQQSLKERVSYFVFDRTPGAHSTLPNFAYQRLGQSHGKQHNPSITAQSACCEVE